MRLRGWDTFVISETAAGNVCFAMMMMIRFRIESFADTLRDSKLKPSPTTYIYMHTFSHAFYPSPLSLFLSLQHDELKWNRWVALVPSFSLSLLSIFSFQRPPGIGNTIFFVHFYLSLICLSYGLYGYSSLICFHHVPTTYLYILAMPRFATLYLSPSTQPKKSPTHVMHFNIKESLVNDTTFW